MAYQVLARKWRPKQFADLVGQEHVARALQNALAQNRLHHAYLLTGTRGVGKTTIARILAKSLNCAQPDSGEPCGVCASCRDIDAGRYVDLLEIDAASNTGIDNIREVLDNAQYAPSAGQYKVYIIDEVHMLSKSAFNAMLKTLEEPPAHVKFILATTDPHKVPTTVLSRCLQFVLRNLTPQQVSQHLAHVLTSENIPFEQTALTILGRQAQGSMRDALSLLDQCIALSDGVVRENDVRQMLGVVDEHHLAALVEALAQRDGQTLKTLADDMARTGVGFDNALTELSQLLHHIALVQTMPDAVPEADPVWRNLAAKLSPEAVQLYYQTALRGKADLPLAPDEYTGFMMTLIRMLAFAPFAAQAGARLVLPTEPAFRQPQTGAPDEGQASAAQSPDGQADAPTPADASITDNESAGLPETPAASANGASANGASVHEGAPEDPPPFLYDSAEHEYEPDYLPQDDAGPSPHHSAQAPKILTPEIAEKMQESAPTHDAEPLSFDEAPQPPELTAQNWFELVSVISPQLQSAQVLLQHSAWVDFDAQANLLRIAISPEGQTMASPERLEKIAQALRTRHPGLRIQTAPWSDALMSPKRQAEHDRRQDMILAQQLLNDDPTAKMLQEGLKGQWLPESVKLRHTLTPTD